ncbi:arginine repressor [Vibrio marisflavi]|uniref:Arginine repressor n=1 Tax=Vibrio marisflavi CECT 7928 TaxID=634439 RepID=A0ABM8ZZW5_9VIBR|nr:arginine repressor [Vibrio marisflavi]CAH0536658.1 Arginine repressor [Vibrio marisflavi CECT 7928]
MASDIKDLPSNKNVNYDALQATDEKKLTAVCKQLLLQQSFPTQKDLREKLVEIGFKGISQSTVSRLLCQLGITKVQNSCGKKVYCRTVESTAARPASSIASQIEFITHNQSTVIVKTHPGSAQLIARLIDTDPHSEILGTVGGNDTVLIVPKDTNNIDICEQVVKERLGANT